VTVTLSGSTAANYKGFFLQARKPDSNTMSYGSFDVSAETSSQTMDCFGQTNVSCRALVQALIRISNFFMFSLGLLD